MLLANVVACANTSLLPGLPVHAHHHLHLQSLPKAPEHPRYRVDHVCLRKKRTVSIIRIHIQGCAYRRKISDPLISPDGKPHCKFDLVLPSRG